MGLLISHSPLTACIPSGPVYEEIDPNRLSGDLEEEEREKRSRPQWNIWRIYSAVGVANGLDTGQ